MINFGVNLDAAEDDLRSPVYLIGLRDPAPVARTRESLFFVEKTILKRKILGFCVFWHVK